MSRLLARALVCLVLTGGLVPLTAGASWACSCMRDDRSEQARYAELARRTELAYVGLVTRRTSPPAPADGQISSAQDSYTYTIQAVSSVRGAVLGTRTVTVSSSGAACGVTLPEGSRVLVTAEPFGLCGGVTTDRVDERAAIMSGTLHRPPTQHRVVAGESLAGLARAELRAQGVAQPASTQVTYAVRAVQRANRRVLGPHRDRLRAGTVLLVPRLV